MLPEVPSGDSVHRVDFAQVSPLCIGLLPALMLLMSVGAVAAEARIAVAANFRDTAVTIARHLEGASPHHYEIIAGSTGKLASQIIRGAPFDILMAADRERPKQLEDRGLTVPGSLEVYAIGEIGLWWPNAPKPIELKKLESLDPRSVCIANPAFSPYGGAAWGLMNQAQFDKDWLKRIARVDNINFVTGAVASGQAEAGFVARSSITTGLRHGRISASPEDVLWLSVESDVEQALVVMTRARDNQAAQFWVRQLRTQAIQAVIQLDGYQLTTVAD